MALAGQGDCAITMNGLAAPAVIEARLASRRELVIAARYFGAVENFAPKHWTRGWRSICLPRSTYPDRARG
jgi:hypothetical protein